jgi:hypothetical protein
MKKGRDPTEFRAPKIEDGKTLKYRFYILPPLRIGDVCNDGKVKCEREMELFAISNGAHYIDNKRLGCPRIIEDEECDICQYAFDLLQEIDGSTTEGKKRRSEIGKQLLPGQYHLVNLYFPPVKINPEELRGKVFWFNAPKTVVDIWLECLYRDDDGGDPEEPLPFGVFFDENNANQFQLEVVKDGQMNSYKRSKFIGAPRPIATDKNTKQADTKRIKEILAKRFNLWEKLPEINREEIARIAATLSGKAPKAASGGFDQDEEATEDEATETPPVQTESKQAAAAKAASKPAATKSSAKPASSKSTTSAKPATKAAPAKAAPVKTKPKDELEDELEDDLEPEAEAEADQELDGDSNDDIAGEAPFDEDAEGGEEVEVEGTEAEAEAEGAEAEADGSEGIDSEVDRLLDELDS